MGKGAGKGAKDAGPQMKGAGQAVAEASYYCSDACFLFPVIPESTFGAGLVELSATGAKNKHGQHTKVHKLHTYEKALDVTKKAPPGSMVGVVTASQGLAMMADNIQAAVQARHPMVVHVAGIAVGENFELHPSVDCAYELMSSGAALVVSASAVDCYAAAIYSYVLAHHLKTPVIHLVDGPLALAASSSAALSWDKMVSMAESMHRVQTSSIPLDVGDFNAFGYYGDRSARTVFVAVSVPAADPPALGQPAARLTKSTAELKLRVFSACRSARRCTRPSGPATTSAASACCTLSCSSRGARPPSWPRCRRPPSSSP